MRFIKKTLPMWEEDELIKRLDGKPENLTSSEVVSILKWTTTSFAEFVKKLGVNPKALVIRAPYPIGRTRYFTHEDVLELNRRYKASKQNADIVSSNF